MSELTKLRWNAISLQKGALFKIQTMQEGRGVGGVRGGCSATDFHIKWKIEDKRECKKFTFERI
jgi:hypothetical protein